MGSMFRRSLFLTVVSILFLASASLAQTVGMELTGVGDGANYGGVYVDPYTATVGNTTNVPIICDDWSDEVTMYETWNATVQNASSLTSTPSPLFGDNPTLYKEAAWLGSQILTAYGANPANTNAQIEYSYALWQLTYCSVSGNDCTANSNTDPFYKLAGSTYLNTAEADLATAISSSGGGPNSSFNDAGWQILTPSPTGQGEAQEFLTYNYGFPVTAPESSPGVLLGADMLGLLGLVFLFRRRLFRPVQ